MNLVETLQSLEPTFIKAGQLALEMQKGITSFNKTNTGNIAGDIVTEADFAVQEFLLKEIAKTDLVNCHLLAEEDTPSTKEFKGKSDYYLGIDPIDDTAIYASGGKHFSTIISLHDGKNILYMFIYYPAWNWIHKVVNGKYEVVGETPHEVLSQEKQNTIICWDGNPEQNLPAEILEELKTKNINFKKVRDFSSGFGSIALFASGKIAGVYSENMNTYDGLAELSIGEARSLRIYRGGESGSLDLTNIGKRATGLYYSIWSLRMESSRHGPQGVGSLLSTKHG